MHLLMRKTIPQLNKNSDVQLSRSTGKLACRLFERRFECLVSVPQLWQYKLHANEGMNSKKSTKQSIEK